MNIVKKEYLLSLACLSLSASVFATTHHHHNYKCEDYKNEAPCPCPIVPTRNHFEVIGALGIGKFNAGNSNLGVTSSETDRLQQSNRSNWDALGAQLGVGYIFNLGCDQPQCSDDLRWFTAFEPELNVYSLAGADIKGNVLRFGNPNFDDLTFDIPIRSTRLMLDGALTIAEQQQASIYAIAGIGEAWNRLSFSDTVRSAPCPEQRLSLNSNTRTHFVWEVGAGAAYAFNDSVGLSLEYLYTHFGKMKLSGAGNTGTITAPVIVPPSFNLSAQTVLLGLHVAI